MNSLKKIKITEINVILGIALMLPIIFTGCKDTLDSKLYSSVGVNSYYKNKDQAQTALNGVYTAVLWNVYKDQLYDGLTDNPGGTIYDHPGGDEYGDFNWSSASLVFQNDWTRIYGGINRANSLLDGMKNSDIAAETKSNISGQAKFLRALYYFNLVKWFGGVPLYTHGTTSLKGVDKPRSSADSVYIQIENDLKDAMQELSPYSESDHADGKATSGAARAMLVKVYAQERKWSKAASTAKKIIENGHFGMLKDFRKVFDPDNKNNKEQIFSIQHLKGAPTNSGVNHDAFRFAPPPQTTKDGLHVLFFHSNKGNRWQANQSFFDQTPDTYRKSQSMRNTMPFYYEVGSDELINKTVKLNDPYIIKYFFLDESVGYERRDVSRPVLRYSDVLLMYAEALNEANGGPTPAAYDAINKVRARARGVGTAHEQPESVYPPLSGLSQSQFRDSVLTEEARELVGEGYRRAELLRHDMFISNAKSRGLDAQENEKLYPIPTAEFARNPNLEQNPEYSE